MSRITLRPAAALRICLSFISLLLAACGDDQVAEVRPLVRVIATHEGPNREKLLDYGPVPVLHTESKALLVRNDGRAPLTLRAFTFEAPPEIFRSGAFSSGPIVVPPGDEVDLEVVFQPTAEEDYVGTVVLEHDDDQTGPITILLKGRGSTVGRIEVQPTLLDFGRVGERQQELRTVTIRSVGTADLIVESIRLEGAAEFSILGSTTTPVPLRAPRDGQPGGSVDLLVACSPTEATESDELSGTLTIRSTDPEAREVVVSLSARLNRAPTAVIVRPDGAVPAPGDSISLDGSGSFDEDGDLPLEYLWRIHSKPLGSNARFDDETAVRPVLLTDLPGRYVIGLDVADAAGLPCLHPGDNPAIPCTTVEVDVKPADDLFFELVWDHPDTDLDLHLLVHGAELYSALDCYYGNRQPDFAGTPVDPDDDPRLVNDVLRGFGPERIVFTSPPEGEFDVTVVFAKTNGAKEPDSTATLRVYVYGVLAAEMNQVLGTRDERWDVLTIDWPSGDITPIDRVTLPPSSEQP